MRNVNLGGQAIGGLSQSDLSMVISDTSEANQSRSVTVETPTGNLETTAENLGLQVDESATEQTALDAQRSVPPPALSVARRTGLRPRGPHPVRRRTGELERAMGQLSDANRVETKEPAILVADDQIVATPGVPGQTLPLDELGAALEHEAQRAGDPSAPVTVHIDPHPTLPRYSDADAQQVATEANTLATHPLAVHVAGATTTIQPATLRTWMLAVPGADTTHLVLGVDSEQASTDVAGQSAPSVSHRSS